MRIPLLATLVLLVLAAPAEAKRPFCDTRPGYTLVSDGSHRIYETIIPVKGDPDADVTTVYVCRDGSRKRSHRLDRFNNTLDGAGRPQSGKLAGRWLLLDVEEETGVTDGHGLELFDLRKARLRASLYADGSDALAYALTSSGAFAASIPFSGGLMAFDAAGTRPLAGETATELAAAGRRVYWADKGVSASAVLGGAPKGTLGDFE